LYVAANKKRGHVLAEDGSRQTGAGGDMGREIQGAQFEAAIPDTIPPIRYIMTSREYEWIWMDPEGAILIDY